MPASPQPDGGTHPELVASVYVNPHWDPEHKLDLLFEGTITAVNGEAFDLINGNLVLR